MNILLVRTPLSPVHLGFRGLVEIEPLHLEYLAANIQDCNIRLFDTWRNKERKLFKEIKEKQWDIVALNCSAVHTYKVYEYAQYIKKHHPKALIVVGGEHPTIAPGYFNKPFIDVVILGAGILKFQQIVEHTKKNIPLEDIKGIALMQNGKINFTEKDTAQHKIDDFNTPDRKILCKERKSYFFYSIRSIATVIFSEGCPYTCSFCCVWKKHNGVNRRDPDKVINELKTIDEEWIFFSDDNFLANETVETFLDALEKSGIKKNFIIEASAELVVQKEHIINRFAALGLKALLIGLEAFNTKNLQEVNKVATVEQNIQSLRVLRKHKVDCLASVIIYPDWDKNDFKELWKAIKQEKITWLHLQCLTPFPGTQLYEEEYHRMTSFNLDLFDMEHMLLPTKLPLKSFYFQMALLYLKTFQPFRFIPLKPNIKLPLNPFYKTFINYSFFVLKIFRAFKHHRLQAPAGQENRPDILSPPEVSKSEKTKELEPCLESES